METRPNPVDEAPQPSAEYALTQREVDDVLWQVGGTLYHRRTFITRVTLLIAVLSVVIALLTPKWFAAEARVLQPEGGGLSLLGGVVSRASGGLSSLLGGGGGYERYLAILSSRSMKEAVVERFNLIDVYDIDREDGPHQAMYWAVEELSGNVSFEISLDYNHLSIVAFDKDPERAADMANFMVARLNEENARLTSETARQTRRVIEDRLDRAVTDLDSVRSALQTFQETHGLLELEAQSTAMMQSLATLKAEAAKLEIQYQTLLQQYGPDNPQVQAARQARRAAQAEVQRALGGQDELLPVALRELPALGNRYARLMQDQLIQQQILETVYPIYEQALFQEQNEAEAVQVVDDAVTPVMAARPSRRLIVIGATLTAFLLASLYVLGQAWLQKHGGSITARLRASHAPVRT